MTRIVLLSLWMLMAACMAPAYAQDQSLIKGVVMEEGVNGALTPLELVHVVWLNTTEGTYTDSLGYFELSRTVDSWHTSLVVTYVGFEPDTILVGDQSYVSVVLKNNTTLETVDVVYRKRTTEVSFLNPALVEKISQQELFKAACCNLSESFETNASVDVSYTDAVSGAKQIEMLGLAGKYSMLSQEFMPGIRGLSIPYGLLYTPGSWVESMQVTKGAGSVVNGYESMTGQINIEIKKPDAGENLFVNGYINEANRMELNANASLDVATGLNTSVLAHGSFLPTDHDNNHDGFKDHSTGHLITVANRWKYAGQGPVRGQVNIKYTRDDKTGGQIGYDPELESDLYGVNHFVESLNLWGKTGFLFPDKRYQSIGFQWSLSQYEQDLTFGNRPYSGEQRSAYANLLFQSIIGSTDHKFKTGISLQYDDIEEDTELGIYSREEVVPGAFFEYTYSYLDKFTLVAGLRADHNSIYGSIVTPRLHARYAITENTVLRGSVGRGSRSANIIAENLGLLASSREIRVQGDNSELPQGLELETAWNMGASISQQFELDFRPGHVAIDFFRTSFTEQVVVDLDVSPQQAVIRNLEGMSFSNAFQVEVAYELFKRLDVKMAYRNINTRTDYAAGRLRKALVPKDRAFVNVTYTTPSRRSGHWQFDGTIHFNGTKRLPYTGSNPEGLQRPDEAPSFTTLNGQVTRTFGKSFSLYAGVENLTNFRQDDAIIAADDPFGPYFDSGLVWGPLFGRKLYVGFRYTLDKE